MTKIYERVGDTIYQRSPGSLSRQILTAGEDIFKNLEEDRLWGEIRRFAKTHEHFAKELDKIIVLYKLMRHE